MKSSVKLFLEITVGDSALNPEEVRNLVLENPKNCLKLLLPELSDAVVSDISNEQKDKMLDILRANPDLQI
jgi:hypothetical protein